MTVQTIGVVGAGSMGTGIANLVAMNGFNVVLNDVNEEQLEQSITRMGKFMDKSIEREKMTEDDKNATLNRIKTTTDLAQLKDADVVIEAVIEDMDLKKSIFKQLDEIVEEAAVLATNTSSLSITEIASATKKPDRVVGLHFFNPAQLMRLVEIIRGFYTSDETVEKMKALSNRLNKVHVEVKKDSTGFIVNRIMVPQFIESIRLLEMWV